jgi:hypothetical protein
VDLTNNQQSVIFPSGSSSAMLRVTVSDGFWTSSDTTDATFSLPNRPPEISVIAPGSNQVYQGTVAVVFQCEAWDAEDGTLFGTNITWYSSLDGRVGTGSLISQSISSLSEGVHTITVVVRDSAEVTNAATSSIRIIHARSPLLDVEHLGNNIELALFGEPQTPHVVECSSNFVDWVLLTTNALAYGWADLSTFVETNGPPRFYRARVLHSASSNVAPRSWRNP